MWREKRRPLSVMADLCHKLLRDLTGGFERSECQGVTDRSRIDHVASQDATELGIDRRSRRFSPRRSRPVTRGLLLQSLKRGLRRVQEQAERNEPDEAASELTTVYMTDFEPLERYLWDAVPRTSGRSRSSSTRCAAT